MAWVKLVPRSLAGVTHSTIFAYVPCPLLRDVRLLPELRTWAVPCTAHAAVGAKPLHEDNSSASQTKGTRMLADAAPSVTVVLITVQICSSKLGDTYSTVTYSAQPCAGVAYLKHLDNMWQGPAGHKGSGEPLQRRLWVQL